ncbi:hypothetical protein PENTCL1PPCAC_15102, partial [Pristionchus entomophagus]
FFQEMRKWKRKEECPTDCVVCGGAATGYNYEAPSCLPCKTFFSRMVLQKRDYASCLKVGLCSKDDSNRPCRSCRLDRCISGGMNPLLIGGLKDPDENPVVQCSYSSGNVQLTNQKALPPLTQAYNKST